MRWDTNNQPDVIARVGGINGSLTSAAKGRHYIFSSILASAVAGIQSTRIDNHDELSRLRFTHDGARTRRAIVGDALYPPRPRYRSLVY